MPELRGMRAVVQFLWQPAEPCAAPPTSPFMDLLIDSQGTGSLPALFVSAAASSLLFSEAAQNSADPGPFQSEN